jgi:hypothetical protein
MMRLKNKLETGLKLENKAERASVDFEKIFYETVLEFIRAQRPSSPMAGRANRSVRINRSRIRDQIVHADSWPERDQLLKSLAAKCYDIANGYVGVDDEKALKWHRLVAKLLSLSFIPKKLDDLELLKKEIAAMKLSVEDLERVDDDVGEA